MKRVALLLAAAFAWPAFAADVPVHVLEGDWSGSGEGRLSMRTIVLDEERGLIAAGLEVSAKQCFGKFAGTGTLKGNVLKLSSASRDAGMRKCVVTLTFERGGQRATIDENECLPYPGAACGFSGTLARRR